MKRLFVGLLFVLMSIFAFAQTIGVNNWVYINSVDKFTDEKYFALFKYANEELSYTEYSMYLLYKETKENIYLCLNAPFCFEDTAVVRFDKFNPVQVNLLKEGSYLHFSKTIEMSKVLFTCKTLLVKLGDEIYSFDLTGFADTYKMAYAIFNK